MTEDNKLYAFDGLRKFLNSKGLHVREPYSPIDPSNTDYYKGGKHLSFNKDGIYLERPNGNKQKVFIYRKVYYQTKPTFHIFACPSIKGNISLIGNAFLCGNTDSLPAVNTKTGQQLTISELPICGYCAEKARLSKLYNTRSYVKLIKTGRSINDVDLDDTLATYTQDWMSIREAYLKHIHYKCERCGRTITDEYDQSQYLIVKHLDYNPENNSFNNLKCYCLDCLSQIQKRSVWVRGGNKEMLVKYRSKYFI